jgi:hypothetical protein
MPVKGQPLTITYQAWNISTGQEALDDQGNHAVCWVGDGVAVVPAASPVQVDKVLAPGVYSVAISATEADCWFGSLAVVSSTDGVKVRAVEVAFSPPNDAGDGTVRVDHDTGGSDNLRLVDGLGVGVADALVDAYLASEYDAGTTHSHAQVTTDADGRWVEPMWLLPGAYVFAYRSGARSVTKRASVS